MVQTPGPATVLGVFYATVIVFVIGGILCDSSSTPGAARPELTGNGSITTESKSRIFERPIFIVLERPNESLSELLDSRCIDSHSVWLGETGRFMPSDWKVMMVLNAASWSDPIGSLADRLGDSIDRFLSRRRSTVPAQKDQRRRWSLEWKVLTRAWYFSYSYNGTDESGSSRSQNNTAGRSNPHDYLLPFDTLPLGERKALQPPPDHH